MATELLPWLSDESQGFRILALGQQLRFAARERYPLLAEGRLNLDALRLECGSGAIVSEALRLIVLPARPLVVVVRDLA